MAALVWAAACWSLVQGPWAAGGEDLAARVNAPGDGFLALRSAPSTERGARLAKIPHGSELILGECRPAGPSDSWCRTDFEGRSGWVLDRYLVRVESGQPRSVLQAVSASCPRAWCRPDTPRIEGDFAAVGLRCLKPNCENDTAYLRRGPGGWEMVDQGTGLTPDDLVGYGFPRDIANRLCE
jgi:hypothetical protein